jgi:type II secretory pathway pseudopilin PulG
MTFLPRRHRLRRSAYTLLELILAIAICVLFLGALFAAMQVQLRHVQAGREVSEHSGLARALLARISNDIAHSLTPPAPAFFSSSSNSSSSPAGTSSGSSTPGSSSSSSSVTANSTFQFDFGLQGDRSKLTLFSCGLPPEPNPQRKELGGDLRFITYWIAQRDQAPMGLARLELKRVTADVAGQLPAAGSAEEAACLIAEEVKSLEFRYLDKYGWNSTWDGTATGPDWLTLVGPPRAIEITLSMVMPTEYARPNMKPDLRVFRHVVAVPTASR